ncbi:MAG TPA: S-layer homology domain-containing protein [Thermaerobacter sp.]
MLRCLSGRRPPRVASRLRTAASTGPPHPADSPVPARRRARWRAGALAAALFLAGSTGPAGAAGPWYADLSGHWAEDEVQVLWEEGVTDGYRFRDADGVERAYFLPDQFIQRAQFAVLVAKVLGLAPIGGTPYFPDVPPGYRAGGDLEAFGWIQAGAAAGVLAGDPDGHFRPDDVTRRDEAVAMLIGALDLQWYAAGLDQERIAALLAPYVDAGEIRPDLRDEMAAAIDLAIVVGYGDGHLRPARPLTRAEAATLLYKSALIRVHAEPPEFSPDGDGHDDEAQFRAEALLNRNQAGWKVEVLRPDGTPVYTWSGDRLPATWSWDGRDELGVPVPAETYLVRGTLFSRQGTVFRSAIKPLTVVYHRLEAGVSPPVVAPGGTITVRAVTEGPALSVTVTGPGPTARPLERRANGLWEASWPLPGDIAEGAHSLNVHAVFPRAERTVTLTLQVQAPLWIRGEAHPNPAATGEAVTVLATTPAGTERVTLRAPDGTVASLEQTAPGRWETRWSVPSDTPPGVLDLELTAQRGPARASATVPLRVEGHVLEQVLFHLSR